MPDAAVSSQITDSVTQANTKVLGDAPAIAMGNLFIATSQALANAAHNATNNQQQAYVVGQAATTQAIATMLSADTAVTGIIAHKVLSQPVLQADVAAPADAGPPTPGVASAAATLSAPPPALAQDLSAAAFDAAKASPDPMLTLMVLDAGALMIFDAVAHLQRVSSVAEAATALALTRLLAEPNGDLWKQAIEAADHSVSAATEHFDTVARMAIDLTRLARGL